MIAPRDLINNETYPIDDLQSPVRRALVERCQRDLDADAICTLKGFVRPEIVTRMAGEGNALSRSAYRNKNMRTPYGWRYNRDFPADHPRAAMFQNNNDVVLTHQFPGNTLIEQLYRWDPLTEFVREALGFDTLYRCACLHLSLMLSKMDRGGQLGWHFDTNDGVISLLLQMPDDGGAFECAPYIRSENDENYDTIARLFAGEDGISVIPGMAPGTFILFKGRRSCHRVTEVGETKQPRLIALFSYDEKPGMVFPESTCQDFMTEDATPYHGRAAPRGMRT
ncbi:MAG: 2OG-Fe(II) oxygenase [Hyphomicrobiaceae bacterium]